MANDIIEISITNVWTKINDGITTYIAKNLSGSPVIIYNTDDGVEPDDNLKLLIGEVIIGGAVKEVLLEQGKISWAKCLFNNEVIIKLRQEGIIDPDTDITAISNATNELMKSLDEHKNNFLNTHKVTANQVGLGFIPKEGLTDDPNYAESDKLPSIKAINNLYDLLIEHKENKENIHEVTKEQVKLGNVDNFKTADEVTELDASNRESFITPAGVAKATIFHAEAGLSIRPQLILEAPMGARLTGWLNNDCSLPNQQIEIVNNLKIIIKSGLMVSFANNSKSLISQKTNTDIALTLPNIDGQYYIYVNLTSKGKIIDCNFSTQKPVYNFYRESNTSDFFNLSTNTMYDTSNKIIYRVYIGKVIKKGKVITKIINIPLGYKTIIPFIEPLMVSKQYIVDNPFLEDVDVIVEVFYNNRWSQTRWNDQIGILASISNENTDEILVQCGQMGFLSSGRESGSVHKDNFLSIAQSLKTRLILIKR